MARLLVQLDRSEPVIEEMIYPTGRRDLERGRASGRFHLQDVDVALSSVAGGTLEIMRKALDGAVPPEAAEWHAEGILRLLGVPAGEAAQIVGVPLPEIDLEAVAFDAPAARPAGSAAEPPAGGAGADDEADDLELTATFARFEPSGAVDGVMHSHREVRRAILDGRLRPGQEISQLQLAERLGVSRTPLREALRILQNEGLVLAETWRRVRIARLDRTSRTAQSCVACCGGGRDQARDAGNGAEDP